MGEQIVTEQDADLVAGQLLEHACRIPHHHREPVGVGVVGEGQIGVDALGKISGQIHCARLFRVRKRDGGEGGVGGMLLGNDLDSADARGGHRAGKPGASDAMQRGVGDLQIAPNVWMQSKARHALQVGMPHALRYRGPQISSFGLLAREQGDPIGGLHSLDRRGDAVVMRRNDLGAVFPVDLVSVVLPGIVAGGDHHRSGRPQVPHREGGHRRWNGIGEVERPNPLGGQRRSGVLREFRAQSASVPPDDYSSASRVRDLRFQVARQAHGGPPNHRPIHPIGACADHSTQTGGAEFQRAAEAIGQLRIRPASEKLFDLARRFGIGIRGAPFLGAAACLVGIHINAPAPADPADRPPEPVSRRKFSRCRVNSSRSPCRR